MDETEVNETATFEEDAVSTDVVTDRTEDEILADILANTDFLEDDDIPTLESLPDDEMEYEGDPDESDSEDPMDEDESEDDVEEEIDEESEEESDDEDASDEDATDEVTAYEEDEVDWDIHVPVTIDGEQSLVSLAELRKGYATEQHLSKKGREIGDARKELEAEREQRLGELMSLTEAVNGMLGSNEQELAQQYHSIDAKIKEAREEGNTYELAELKDQREQAQQAYWEARNKREAIVTQALEQQQQAQAEEWNTKVEKFFSEIEEVIPGYDDKYAEDLRTFGGEIGLSEEFMATIADVTIVKALDDYRKLKQGVSEGAKKRKKVSIKKAPVKKAKPATQKKVDADNMIKARAFRQDATQDDQMAFLRNYASKSLNQ
jgi:hypothetical protein